METTREEYVVKSPLDKELTLEKHTAIHREYDEKGRILLDINYDFRGNISEKYAYCYDELRIIEKSTYFDENEIGEKELYFYEGEKLKKIKVQYVEGYEEIFELSYDKEGRKISKSTVSEEGEKQLIEYNEQMEIIYNYNEDNELESKEVIERDKKGLLISKESENYFMETYELIKYHYNNNDKISTELHYDRNGNETDKIEFEYDTNYRPIVIRTISEAGESFLYLSYDKNGNEILQEEKDEDGLVNHRVEREFDDEGNVLKTHVQIFNHGYYIDSEYTLRYQYEFYN